LGLGLGFGRDGCWGLGWVMLGFSLGFGRDGCWGWSWGGFRGWVGVFLVGFFVGLGCVSGRFSVRRERRDCGVLGEGGDVSGSLGAEGMPRVR
jgi:hypothetical protein